MEPGAGGRRRFRLSRTMELQMPRGGGEVFSSRIPVALPKFDPRDRNSKRRLERHDGGSGGIIVVERKRGSLRGMKPIWAS